MVTHSASRGTLVLAALLFLAPSVALARSAAPHGGAGGPPLHGGIVEHVLASMKSQLALDTSQQVMFDAAAAQTMALREQAFANRSGLRSKVEAELAKAEPDLAAIAGALDAVEEQGRVARRQVRDQWLRFYANLRPDQKTIVRDAIKVRLERAEGMRERMRGRLSGRAPT